MILAPYAITEDNSRGRLYKDFPKVARSAFQRDRDRIIYSEAFRLLDGKTQVILGENRRTRLTHSLEVSQISRTICRNLSLNEDVGETIALAHDLGHPPFGHSGEKGLQVSMENFGGFDHNLHSLKIITKIETHYPQFEGLNLSWEILEGIAKHNGPIKNPTNKYLLDFNKKFDLALDTYPSLEAQIANLADDIAYNNHDLDDGFRGGFFTIKDLRELPFIDKTVREFEKEYPNTSDKMKMYSITRNSITRMVLDVIESTKSNIEKFNIKTIDDVRKQSVADFSTELEADIKQLRKFLMDNFYRAPQVSAENKKSQEIVKTLFNSYNVQNAEDAEKVCVKIAGMTDREATEEFNKY